MNLNLTQTVFTRISHNIKYVAQILFYPFLLLLLLLLLLLFCSLSLLYLSLSQTLTSVKMKMVDALISVLILLEVTFVIVEMDT